MPYYLFTRERPTCPWDLLEVVKSPTAAKLALADYRHAARGGTSETVVVAAASLDQARAELEPE